MNVQPHNTLEGGKNQVTVLGGLEGAVSAGPVPKIEALRLEAIEDEAAPNIKQLSIIPMGERAFDTPAPIEYLIDQISTKQSVNILVGDAGSGKTYVMIDMALRVATGRDWLGHKTEQSPVLIIDEESGERRLTRRIHEAIGGQCIKPEDNPPVYAVCFENLDGRNPEDINAIERTVIMTGAQLVIIDALMEIVPGADENSVKDMLPALINLRGIAERTGAAFWIIHHSNKNGGYRGTTAIKGKVDCMLMVEKPKGSKFIKFTPEKFRDTEERAFTAEAHWIAEPPQFYLSLADIETQSRDLKKSDLYILQYLADNPGAAMTEIRKATDASATAVKSLDAAGYIEMTTPGGKGRGNAALYDLTEKGRDAIKGEG